MGHICPILLTLLAESGRMSVDFLQRWQASEMCFNTKVINPLGWKWMSELFQRFYRIGLYMQ